LGARDAGLDMVMGELTTAGELNLSVIVIVFADAFACAYRDETTRCHICRRCRRFSRH
jgi:thiamine pyrophosphate-dependent acetolactate synthase large subunit-like protein